MQFRGVAEKLHVLMVCPLLHTRFFTVFSSMLSCAARIAFISNLSEERDQGNEIEIEIEQWNYSAFITPLIRIWKKFDAVEISRNQ